LRINVLAVEYVLIFVSSVQSPLNSLYAELVPTVVMEITYTEPGVRGDSSSTSSLKQATIETGITIMVPLFCVTGDKIRINTTDNSYQERVK
jgi:elongation factor P